MRKQIILLLAVHLPLFAFDMNADESEKKVIPLERRADKWIERTASQILVDACYYGILSSVVTVTAVDLGEVSLTITNLSTGETWHDSFDSSYITQVMTPISGSTGTYEIVYITESGEVYEGNFML